MGFALSLITLFNAVSPGIAQLVLLIREKDGSIGVVSYLDEADAQFATNIQQATDWFKQHPKG